MPVWRSFQSIGPVRLINWLDDQRQHVNIERSICANCEGGKPAQAAQAAKDGQRDTMHITLRCTNIINCSQNNTSVTYTQWYYLLIIKLAPSPNSTQANRYTISLGVEGVKLKDTRTVHTQQNATAQYPEYYLVIFLWTDFRAPECASKGDNRHNFTLTPHAWRPYNSKTDKPYIPLGLSGIYLPRESSCFHIFSQQRR